MAHRLDFASRLTLAACEALMNLNGLPAQEVSARPLSTVPISPNSTQVPTEICSGSTQDWNNPCVFLKPGMTFCWSYVRKGADMTHLLSPRQPSVARGGCTSDPPPHPPPTPVASSLLGRRPSSLLYVGLELSRLSLQLSFSISPNLLAQNKK